MKVPGCGVTHQLRIPFLQQPKNSSALHFQYSALPELARTDASLLFLPVSEVVLFRGQHSNARLQKTLHLHWRKFRPRHRQTNKKTTGRPMCSAVFHRLRFCTGARGVVDFKWSLTVLTSWERAARIIATSARTITVNMTSRE